MTEALRRLGRRITPRVAAVLAFALSSPALLAGEAIDDHFHRAALDPRPALADVRSDHGMFGFLDDDAERTRAMVRRGVFPWWTGERTRVAFFRPLAELTHRLDHQLLGGRPVWMHLQSLLWAALLVLAVGRLYRRVLGAGPSAGLAALLFAVDDAHGVPFGWLANRNAILAGLFGVLAIIAHDRWRRGGSRAHALAAPALFALSLLSAEAGVATLAYLAAHAATLDRARGWRRSLALVPAITVVLGWRCATAALGYGVVGSGLYVDPLGSPARFLAAAARRVPALLAGQWGPIPSDAFGLSPAPVATVATAVAAVLVPLLLAALWRATRADRAARFCGLGMLLALTPSAATLPSDRLLVFVGIGAMGWLARALPKLLEGRGRALAWGLCVVHLALAPVLLPVRACTPAIARTLLDPCMSPPPDAERVIALNAPDLCPPYAQLRAQLEGREGPRTFHTLSGADAPLTITRTNAHTLRVRREGGWFSTPAERVFWDADEPWSPGWRRDLDGLAVEVVEATADGRPLAITVQLEVRVDDPAVRWVHMGPDGALVPLAPPSPGESRRVGGDGRAIER